MTGKDIQHLGLVLVLIGTLALAFAFKTEEEPNRGKKELEKLNPFLRFWYPTRVTIRRKLFWGGIVFVFFGTLFQW